LNICPCVDAGWSQFVDEILQCTVPC